jgi:hypothetical protein
MLVESLTLRKMHHHHPTAAPAGPAPGPTPVTPRAEHKKRGKSHLQCNPAHNYGVIHYQPLDVSQDGLLRLSCAITDQILVFIRRVCVCVCVHVSVCVCARERVYEHLCVCGGVGSSQ